MLGQRKKVAKSNESVAREGASRTSVERSDERGAPCAL
ncbi:hypothetical protein KPSA1_06699 [Pseudomonas syringae pv. actinidiae]|uniref:Uncharacterized protein n=1 Tax=Pseudomonas syringae pv. actinidiae TaxID=103796 RepID=A0A2V0QJC0_PSESF|nr:hypothetical protein KPSA1_06699 [Pseudomonas syringae pv. actinidiae]GBH15244.1 hypothetical protein KPSA3_01167 [Pseudomonas syringae pv. actinidiae]